jgi:predicted MPP superfamily phosphohydrolase
MFRLLHVSDIHFDFNNDGLNTLRLRHSLCKYLRDEVKPFDALIITGDFCSATNKGEVGETVEYIKNIANAAKISNYSQIYMVPGNHDINRSDARKCLVEPVKEGYSVDKGKFDGYIQQLLCDFDFFRDVEKKLYEGTGREFFLPEKQNPHFVCIADHFNLLHINTAILACGDNDEGTLLVGTIYLFDLLKNAETTKLPIIAIGHHALDMLETAERNEVIKLFNDFDTPLYLCGHSHKSQTGHISGIHQIVAGCLKKDEKQVVPNFFEIEFYDNFFDLEINFDKRKDEFTVVSHEWDNGWCKTNDCHDVSNEKNVDISESHHHVAVSKTIYNLDETYISRKLNEYGYDKKNKIPLFLDRGYLYNICLQKKHIIIIAEAGVGKSTDMANLAYMLSHDEEIDLYPILISLKNFLDSIEIETYISEDYKKISPEKLYLLFDGYDEIENNHRRYFERKINNFARNNPQVNIVISTRVNF